MDFKIGDLVCFKLGNFDNDRYAKRLSQGADFNLFTVTKMDDEFLYIKNSKGYEDGGFYKSRFEHISIKRGNRNYAIQHRR